MSCSCGLTGCYDSPELAAFQEAYDTACRKLCVNAKPFNSDDNKKIFATHSLLLSSRRRAWASATLSRWLCLRSPPD